MTNEKKINPTTPKVIKKKRRSPELSFGSWRQWPVTDAALEHMAHNLVEWVTTGDKALSIQRFLKDNRRYRRV
jgi:hypothetical protein